MAKKKKEDDDKFVNLREKFIYDQIKKGLAPMSIVQLCDQKGFKRPSRTLVWRVCTKYGLKMKAK